MVVDASVAVKWVLPVEEKEPDTGKAFALLAGIGAGTILAVQPPHWLAEVASVITRLNPGGVETTLGLLDAMEFAVADEIGIYLRASRMAEALNHHLFDTLYHSVALERDAVLVTADYQYERKARSLGAIQRLATWNPPQAT